MKKKTHYLVTFILVCICIYTAGASFSKTEYVSQHKLSQSAYSVWNKAISNSVNKYSISMYVDGIDTKAKSGSLFMNESMTLMVPLDVLTEAFDCSVSLYQERNIVIEKGTNILRMTVDEHKLSINGAEFRMADAPLYKSDVLYIPLTAIIKGFGYTYTWDVASNKAILINDNPEFKILPYSYSFREKGKATSVKDQGVRSTCWAFAALSAVETTLMPEERAELSVDHMSMSNSFNISQFDGGEYMMALAYLTAWQGPVYEKDDPYGDRVTDNTLAPVYHVQEAQIIESKNLDKIKEMVYKYGGVQSSLYTSITGAEGESKYYNKENFSYCYIGEEKPNHDIVIIGWDDNYPKENFNANVESNGAFICQSSWGESFGDNGVFYVSYLDTNIGVHNIVYTSVENVENYDKIYQTDLCGWQGILGYEQSKAYFANVYTCTMPETVKAVGFYATDVATSYSVYIIPNYTGMKDINSLSPVATGKFENAGYYTVELDTPVNIAYGKYAVIVKIDTPNSQRPVAIEMAKDYATLTVTIDDGEGYISHNGNDWERVEDQYNCNICLKVYTDFYVNNELNKDKEEHEK